MIFTYHWTLTSESSKFVMWEDSRETSTLEVESLPGLRATLASSNRIQDLDSIGARSAKLILALFTPNYFGDIAKIVRFKQRAEVEKVVN